MSLALVVNTTFTYKKFNKMEKMKVKYKVNYKCLWLQLILLDILFHHEYLVKGQHFK